MGRGSFATVRKATRKSDGKVFAIKIVSKSALEKDDLAVVHDEIKIMNEVGVLYMIVIRCAGERVYTYRGFVEGLSDDERIGVPV